MTGVSGMCKGGWQVERNEIGEMDRTSISDSASENLQCTCPFVIMDVLSWLLAKGNP